MSSAGECIKALVAQGLGYESVADTEIQIKQLVHYTRHEGLVKMALEDEGYELQHATTCPQCLDEFGDDRKGIHTEFSTDIIRVIGHLDGKIRADNGSFYPLEIKSLGRFSFDKCKRESLEAFPGYVAQEACYLYSENSPGFYVVCNRDTGEMLKYAIPYGQVVSLGGFSQLDIHLPIESIIDNLHIVDIFVTSGALPEIAYNEKSCRWCRFRYLCTDENRTAKVETLPSLLEAAEIYKEGKRFEAMAKDRIEQARTTFVAHSKTSGIDKYTCGGISVSYLGQRTRTWLDEVIIRAEASLELIEKATKQSVPWDDIRLRLVKED